MRCTRGEQFLAISQGTPIGDASSGVSQPSMKLMCRPCRHRSRVTFSPAPCTVKTGDVGAVLQVYSEDAVEVEFVTASGRTQALVTLATASIRPVGSKDILAVRQLDAA